MCMAVQVSDRLGDKNLARYAKALAGMLDSTRWSNRKQMKPMQSVFMSLETHLQHDVLQKVLCPLGTLVREWPLPLKHVRPVNTHLCLKFNLLPFSNIALCLLDVGITVHVHWLSMACLQPIPPGPTHTCTSSGVTLRQTSTNHALKHATV